MPSSTLASLLRDNPVVITGLGCLSAGGDSPAELWEKARRGESPARAVEFETESGVRTHPVCAVSDLEPLRSTLHPVRRNDRCVKLAWLAANQAWTQAGLAEGFPVQRTGLIAGSSRGPLGKIGESFTGSGRARRSPALAATSTFAGISGALAQAFGLEGPGGMVSVACASGAFAIGLAAEQILLGKADIMLAGGVDAALHAAVLSQFDAAGVLGSHADPRLACRPFDRTRNGFVPGEGSAFLVLESARSAASRGVPVLCRLAGWSTITCRSGRTGVPCDGAGLVRVMKQAMELSGMKSAEIDGINAHGTGTVLNDAAEARAVVEVFGDRAALLPCSSTKPVTGHCLGATPALEAVIAIQALAHQMMPPTAHCQEQDPACPLNVVAGTARPARLRSVMSNSLGFWGYHASLIFSTAGG